MNRIICLLFFVCCLNEIILAQSITISGYVLDVESKEPVIGANVFNVRTIEGTTTNNFGYFALKIENENDSVCVSFVGYKSVVFQVMESQMSLTIELKSGEEIEEVNIFAARQNSNEVIKPMSIDTKTIKLMPSISGEADLMKAYQYLPGISYGAEGNNSLYVRGGSPDQNLILLDDVPLYYVNHIGGIVSVFDENAINNVEVYKSGFPARYGGRLSSVIDVRMQNGNLNKTGGEFSIGLISSKIHLNGPIIKDKISYMITVRKSMTDLYMLPLSHYSMGSDGFLTYSFYDLNAKVNWKVNENNRLYLSAYSGTDGTRMRASFMSDDKRIHTNFEIEDYKFIANIADGWGNRLVCLRWNHLFGPKLFSNFTVASTKYFFSTYAGNEIILSETGDFSEKYSYDFKSGLNDNLAKLDFDYFINNNAHLKFGASYTNHNFNTGYLHNLYDINEEVLSDTSILRGNLDAQIDTVYGVEYISTNEIVSYIEGEMKLSDRLKVNAGMHLSAYLLDEYSNVTIQPRLALCYNLNKNISFSGSYARMVQNIHMLTSSDTSTPSDIWLPASKNAHSENSDQVSVGYEQGTGDKVYGWNVEVFYKRMNNLVDYKLGYSLISSNENWYNKIETRGKGWCYGLELMFEKRKGDFTGWVAYTLSKNLRQFQGINNNIPFEYVYDKPHDFSLVANYRLSKQVTLSATWDYSSGRRVTLGTAAYENNVVMTSIDRSNLGNFYYESDKYLKQFVEFGNEIATIYGTKNNFRLPDYHKLNVSFQFTKQKKRGVRTWILGVQNVYNRMNAYNVFYTTNADGTFELNKITLFPIMPNISYRFKF